MPQLKNRNKSDTHYNNMKIYEPFLSFAFRILRHHNHKQKGALI